jgi:hypothetical protein
MNRYFLAASAFAAFTAGIHLILGGMEIVTPMMATEYEPVSKATMYAVWHIVSADLMLAAVGLLLAGLSPRFAAGGVLPLFIAAMNASWSLVFVGVSATTDIPIGWTDLPQPILFAPVIALSIVGAIRDTRRP